MVVAFGAGAYVWWDGRQAPNPPPPSTAAASRAAERAPRPAPPAPRITAAGAPKVVRPAAPTPESGLFRCEGGGRTTYQSGPCARGQKQVEVGQGTLNVVPAPKFAPAPPPPASGRGGAAFGHVEAPKFALVDHERCRSLQRRIDEIDARARVRSTERLRHQRRELVEEMDELRCETWPS